MSITAQIKVNERGLKSDFSSEIILWENDRPTLAFRDFNHRKDDVRLIPTLENSIHDAMVYIAIAVLKNEEIIKKINAIDSKFIEMDNLQESIRLELYEMTKKIEWPSNLNILITTFYDSLLCKNQNEILEYNVKVDFYKSNNKYKY